MSKKNYDPRLREAMDEIKYVMKKHDIGGYISLHSKSHSEFQLAIDIPTWSIARFIREGAGVHLKLYTKSRHADTENTVAMIASIMDLSGMAFMQCKQLMEKIEQQIKVIHVPFGPNGITNEDRT